MTSDRERADGIVVKPLRFEKQNVDGTLWASELSVVGEYRVSFDSFGEEWLALKGILIVGRGKTSEVAKAAAQADYESRVRSALDTDAIAAALASVRPKPTTNDKAVADVIVDEIAQKGVSWDDKQWDFAVDAIEAALASVREEERERLAQIADGFAYSDDNRFAYKLLIRIAESVRAGVALNDQSFEEIQSAIRSRQTPTGTGESRG